MEKTFSPALLLLRGVLIVGAISFASAREPIFDGFDDYGAGVALEDGANGSPGVGLDGGTGWAGSWDVNNAIKSLVKAENRSASPVVYAAGGIALHGGERALRFYDVANGTYAVQRPLGASFSATAGETLWVRFLFRTSAASPLTNQDFFQVGFDDNGNAAAGNPRVSLGANTVGTVFSPSQPFQFFARSTTTVANSAFAGDVAISAGTTYLLVAQIVPSGGLYSTVNLFVNPTSISTPPPPSATISANSGLSTLSHLFIRTVGLDNGDAFVMDELLISDNYTAAVSPGPLPDALRWASAPQPGDAGLLMWSALFGGVRLEASTSLNPGEWSEIPGPFTRNADDFLLPVAGTPEGRAFFRLKR